LSMKNRRSFSKLVPPLTWLSAKALFLKVLFSILLAYNTYVNAFNRGFLDGTLFS
jgi:hypothetical protein